MSILKAKTVFLKISEKCSFFSPVGRETHSKHPIRDESLGEKNAEIRKD